MGELKRRPVLLIVLLTFVTAGIYPAVWFLTRRRYFNDLGASEKIGIGFLIFLIVISSLGVLTIAVPGFIEGFAEEFARADLLPMAKRLDWAERLIALFESIGVIVLAFKVRRIFDEHFNIKLRRSVKFSKAATFFFKHILFAIQDESVLAHGPLFAVVYFVAVR